MSEDKKKDETEKAPVPPQGGTGVAGLFKRAVAAHQEKAAPAQVVAGGIELTKCKHCGAPRQLEELVCRFCKEKL